MAKNCSVLSIRSNIVEENRKILNELRNQRQVYKNSKEDLIKLFEGLNCKTSSKAQHDVPSPSSSLYNKQGSNAIYGPIQGFEPGSWWGIRMDCARDRVHDSFNADVQAGSAGATSVCTSQLNVKGDIDIGDYLTLTGQRFSEGAANDDPLILNYKNQVPVRLIRSYNLSNPFAPNTGYRYDGLYAVIAYWIGINSDSTKHNKFALMRLPNQEPAAWQRSLISNNNNSDSMSLLKQNDLRHSLPSIRTLKNNIRDSHMLEKNINDRNKDSKELNIKSSKIVEQPKDAQCSIIVKRQSFTKSHNEGDSPSTVNNAFVSNENSTHFSIHESKAQSTNISIRTDLYDSSHNVQPDTKKTTVLLSKTLKSTLPPRRIAQHSENVNVPKVNNVNKLNVKKNTSEDDIVPEAGSNAISQENTESTSKADLGLPAKVDQSNSMEPRKYNKKRTHTGQSYTVQFSKRVCHPPSSSQNSSNEVQNKVPENQGNSATTLEKGAQDEKPLESLDSLTPDEILNLINKQKCHPLSQFLIDSMIGLGPEESLKLRTCDSLKAQSDVESVAKKPTKKGTSKKYSVNDKCCKLNRRKELSVSRADRSRVEKYRRILRSRSGKNNKLIEKKFASSKDNKSTVNMKSKRVYKNNLASSSRGKRKDNETRNSSKVDLFNNKSKGALNDKRNSKDAKNVDTAKHRKQRREITNLIIDAKITPITRGPRNRRLRSIGNAYGKKRCCEPSFKSFYCGTEKRLRRKSKLSKSSDCLKRVRRRQGTSYRRPGVALNSRGGIRADEAETAGRRRASPCCAKNWRHRVCCLHDQPAIARPTATDAMVQCSLYPEDARVVPKTENPGVVADPSASSPYLAESKTRTVGGPESRERTSAFVPVDAFDSQLRVARLRSLGFKPIAPGTVDESTKRPNSRVASDRDAQEVYSKYGNEEGSLVGYMDEDLSYQDIEDEVAGGRMVSVSVGSERASSAGTLTGDEHDLEPPWHGWKRVVANDQSFWVGW